MGRHAAGEGFLAGLARHGGDAPLVCHAESDRAYADFRRRIGRAAGTERRTAHLRQSEAAGLAAVGCLYLPGPGLARYAWSRRSFAQRGWSLCGVTHTTATARAMDDVLALATAPVQPWDALVCTSRAVRDMVGRLLDGHADYLAGLFGRRADLPLRLPVIPLGVDCDAHAPADAGRRRADWRARLGAGPDDVVVLYVGRLNHVGKAHPLPMLLGLARAAAASARRVHLVQAGWFAGPAEEAAMRRAGEVLAPALVHHFPDGRAADVREGVWHAADVFVSLVDNVQETFGLTPIEAMAAGLPVVVSDWDGYRYTVRDGIDGLLIPTLGSAGGGPGELLAQLHTLGLETYQTYVGAVAQHTAVHLGRATEALVQLVSAPEQRAAMGAAAQRRAQERFSWPVVVGQYNALFAELAERRSQALRDGVAGGGCRSQPNRGDPFTDFRGFATHVLAPEMSLRLADGLGAADLKTMLAVDLNRLYPGLRGTPAEALALLEQLGAAEATPVAALLANSSPERRPYLETTLVWLAKLGLVDWLP